jgi:hypothetical protein
VFSSSGVFVISTPKELQQVPSVSKEHTHKKLKEVPSVSSAHNKIASSSVGTCSPEKAWATNLLTVGQAVVDLGLGIGLARKVVEQGTLSLM